MEQLTARVAEELRARGHPDKVAASAASAAVRMIHDEIATSMPRCAVEARMARAAVAVLGPTAGSTHDPPVVSHRDDALMRNCGLGRRRKRPRVE
tara:strand:+ start:692 stop:976 length:285 start_codon:yes stop_codon:yes gene_type:complete